MTRPEGQPGTIVGPSVFIGPLTYPAVRATRHWVWDAYRRHGVGSDEHTEAITQAITEMNER